MVYLQQKNIFKPKIINFALKILSLPQQKLIIGRGQHHISISVISHHVIKGLHLQIMKKKNI
jgi:dTDP-4-dehydrorhamnose 3,5-epimerase-like enzyme